jgi:hypothetical protein
MKISENNYGLTTVIPKIAKPSITNAGIIVITASLDIIFLTSTWY